MPTFLVCCWWRWWWQQCSSCINKRDLLRTDIPINFRPFKSLCFGCLNITNIYPCFGLTSLCFDFFQIYFGAAKQEWSERDIGPVRHHFLDTSRTSLTGFCRQIVLFSLAWSQDSWSVFSILGEERKHWAISPYWEGLCSPPLQACSQWDLCFFLLFAIFYESVNVCV